jgi:N-acetylneuraminate lyase
LNYNLIEDYYALLVRNHIQAIFICGTTGEGELLTVDERKKLTEKWLSVSKSNKDFKVIVVVGSNRMYEAIELAQHAQQNGCYGISYISPYYYKPSSLAALVSCCKKVADSVPNIPFYYYHIPVLAQVRFPMIDFMEQASQSISNFAGIKYSDEDHVDFLKCLEYHEAAYNVFWGKDETLLSALSIGAVAAIGSTYNYMSPLYTKLINAFQSNDIKAAKSLQLRSIEVVNLLNTYTGLSTGKYFMQLLGIDCGPSRSPLNNLSDSDKHLLKEKLHEIGFSNFSMK